MYNRYIPRDGVYTRVPEQDIDDIRPPLPPPPPPLQPQQQQTPPLQQFRLPQEMPSHPPQHFPVQERGYSGEESRFHGNAPANVNRGGSPLSNLFSSLPFHFGEKGGGLTGILKNLKLDDLDTGDILLMLILLFLFLESDDEELIITLALMLIIGL